MLMFVYVSQVKPIVGNKAIESIEKPVFRAQQLRPFFAPLAADEVAVLSQEELETHLTAVNS